MTIKDLEERTGLSRANIRFYEKEGLLSPLRRENGYREYTEADVQTLKTLRPEESLYGWGLRFLQTVPGVTMVLSGLSSVEQTMENTAIISEEKPLNQQEWDTLQSIAAEMISKKILPCTGCRYCVSHCPQELNIPALLELYKEAAFTGGGFIAPRAMLAMPREKRSFACIGCRSCEAFCPQGIKISEALADLSAKTVEFLNPKK